MRRGTTAPPLSIDLIARWCFLLVPSQSAQPRHLSLYFLDGTTGIWGGFCGSPFSFPLAHLKYSVLDLSFSCLTKARAFANGHICTYFAEGLLPRKSDIPCQPFSFP